MKNLITAIALSLVTLAAPVASAQQGGDKVRAQTLLREGNALLSQKQYAQALVKFEAAYEIYPSPALLLNIGTSLRALGRNADAANAYARWIKARANPQRLAEVEEVLGELDKKVARVELAVSVDGARVVVDGRPLAPGLSVIRLEPGAHIIVAQKDGHADARAEIRVDAGRDQTVELTLEPSTAPDTGEPADATPTPTDPGVARTTDSGSSGTALKIAGLSTAALGLVAVGVGVKFGLDARDISDELSAVGTPGGPDAWTPELLARQDDGETAETRFFIFTAIGGAAVIAGGVMSYLGFTAGGDADDSLAIAPAFGDDSAGWVVSGRF